MKGYHFLTSGKGLKINVYFPRAAILLERWLTDSTVQARVQSEHAPLWWQKAGLGWTNEAQGPWPEASMVMSLFLRKLPKDRSL